MNRRESLKTISLASAGMVLLPSFKTASNNDDKNYFTLSLRLHPNMISSQERFDATATFINQYTTIINELAIFDETFPSSPSAPLEYVETMASILKQRIKDFKNIGIPRVGIDILNTVGHGDKMGNWPMPFQPMIGHDGRESSSPCYNDKEFLGYITKKVEILAKSNPDFIWIDDDFRVGLHGADYPCFARFACSNLEKKIVVKLWSKI
jgi:hypothetical protein